MKDPVQDQPGTTHYIWAPIDLSPVPGVERTMAMTWTVTGRIFDCTVDGKAIVNYPAVSDPNIPGGGTFLDPRKDPSRPAYGYLNVVGLDGGDFHSVMIKAFDPDARFTKTCPGDPPTVTEEPFGAGYVLHILWHKNRHVDGRMRFEGTASHDQGNLYDFMNLLPPGTPLPQEAIEALSQTSTSSTSSRYTWKWELYPLYR